MERLIYAILLLAFVCTACKHDLPEPSTKKKNRTVIVYAAAENSLSKFFYSDSIEMAMSVTDIPNDVNFIVYKDGVNYPAIYSLTSKKGFTLHKQYSQDQDSADSTVMLTTLRDIEKDYPAEHYSLILWSHGSGWISKKQNAPRKRTILIDNNINSYSSNHGTEMDITELHWVLKNFNHLDYILFDACFMQSIESDYELRDVTDYIIGSPAEIPGNGAPYDKLMAPLCEANVYAIPNVYYSDYKDGEGVAISLVDCSQLEELAEKTAVYIPEIARNQTELSTDSIQYYAPFSSSNSYRPEPYDMNGFMHKFLSKEDYQDWKVSFDNAVPLKLTSEKWTSVFYQATITDPENYGGVSMFVPNKKYNNHGWNYQFKATQWYKAAGWGHTGW